MRHSRLVLGATAFVAVCASSAVSPAQLPERVSSIADQQQVGVTIYNANLALVHDKRRVSLSHGRNRVAWRDVSANMDATSALLVSDTDPGSVSVAEQNFNFDLLSPATLLKKYVGRDVTVVHDTAIPGEPRREKARVLSDNDGVVLQYSDRIETQVDGHIVYPSLPENLRDRPTLVLDLESGIDRAQELELSYLTGGLDWHADYVGLVSQNGERLDLNGLVTLSNTSGTSYRDARLQLVAGNVNVAPPPPPMMKAMSAEVAPQGAPFAQENFGEYHLYTLGRPTTIEDNQTKQVALMSAHQIPVHKTLELHGQTSWYEEAEGGAVQRPRVQVFVSFENKGGELGIPLPGGTVRLYQHDSAGRSQFLGADRIDHTPKNETVRLHVGDAFDVTAHRRQTNYHAFSSSDSASSYEIILKNAKDAAVDVLVVEPIPGDWQITNENQRHTKPSAFTAQWNVHVPADGQATLTYTARTHW